MDWIYGSEVKPRIRSNNSGSREKKRCIQLKKTVESGKIGMPDNEIHVSWIKTLDPKYKSLFYCWLFFYFA